MKEFLRNLKLIDTLKMEFNISKSEFVSVLKKNVDYEDSRWSSSPFEAYKKSENIFIGKVDLKGFKIRRRVTFAGPQMSQSKALGTYVENEQLLIVITEISAFLEIIYGFIAFSILFIGVHVMGLINNESSSSFILNYILPIIIFMFFLLVFYYQLKGSVAGFKRELERELNYIINKSKIS